MAKSTYYYWVKKLEVPDKYLTVKTEIKKIVEDSCGRYGYRRVTLALRNKGLVINHKTVRKLMSQLGLTCKLRPKRYKSYRGTFGKIANNILKRDFEATKPNQKWATDVTEFHLFGKKMYLSPIIDMFNGEIISYSLFKHPVYKMVDVMLSKAFGRKDAKDKVILHSDQGWHYQMSQYQKALKENNVIQSMSRKGNCLDNAVMKNFFGILKSEFYYAKKFHSIEDFSEELHVYIKWYNNQRIKEKLNGLSPVQFRKQSI